MKNSKLLALKRWFCKPFVSTSSFTCKHWEYETKCRRCGKLTAWHFSDKNNINWIDFTTSIQDYIEHPRAHHCKKCDISTVQDVTAYSAPN